MHNILELNVENEDIHVSNCELFIGTSTREFIESNDDIEPHKLTIFYNNCLKYYITSVSEIKKRCPLGDPFLKLLSFLDPRQCNQLQLSNVLQIAQRFPNVIKEEEIGYLKDEVEDFKLQDFENELLQQDLYSFWNSISKLKDPVSGET